MSHNGQPNTLLEQRWFLRRRPAPQFLQQTAHLNLPPLLCKVLYARKFDTPERIEQLLGGLEEAADPLMMSGMEVAVERIHRALSQGEPIAVYGDFDVDGVSATTLLVSALRLLGACVSAYIPNRFDEAYGLNKPALERLAREGARLVVTVDCGVRSVAEVAHAQTLGLDLIVTDHHSAPKQLPPALAIIDPKQPHCAYPFKDLSGVGIAYRLAQALCRNVAGLSETETEALLAQFLDLVALGTVADIAPLVGENRAFVQRGLECMRANPRLGLRALMQVASVDPAQVDSLAVGFRLAPRLNAAGRLKSAQVAYDLLACEQVEEAQALADELDALNQERQRLLEEQVAEARRLLEPYQEHPLFVIDAPFFHEGIVGLVASRLTEEYYRPCLVMKTGEITTRGSARSIEGFHITSALDTCSDLFLRHGGHARAAGFTLLTENLCKLREHLEQYAGEHLSEDLLARRQDVDAIVALAEVDATAPQALEALQPFGEGNPEPRLATLGLNLLEARPVGTGDKHLRLTVSDGTRSLPAIGFGLGHLAAHFARGDKVDLLYCPTLNTWQGQTSVQLVVTAIRPHGGG